MDILKLVRHENQRWLEDDACRWRFLSEHWHSLILGIPLHQWIDEHALRLGGLTAAVDHAMTHKEIVYTPEKRND